MNPKELYKNYQENKNKFHSYVDNIKKNMKVDIYSVINTTLIKNPYSSDFPKIFFSNTQTKQNKTYLFFINSIKFYVKIFIRFINYSISFIIYRIYFKNKKINFKNKIIIDVFFLVDNILKDKKFNEKYFVGLYDVLEKYNKKYVFLPRLYGVNKNPFKLIEFFKIINQDNREFLFEFELLSFKDFLLIMIMILKYPFVTISLSQKVLNNSDLLFNESLMRDISSQNFDSFIRYVLGKNISKLPNIEKIYSWSEFQVVERSFNYAIRNNNKKIKLIGCQFYLNYETYFNAYIDEIDFENKSSPHEVMVNGQYYIQDKKQIKYKNGVSLRYKDIFSFDKIKIGQNILLLGSYIESDTKNMLESVKDFDRVLFKNHPTVNINKFGKFNSNISVVNDNIYKLFEESNIVIGTASGTSVEAVACAVSVIIIASQDNLTANPLVEHGKGKIWDIAFSKDEVKVLYNKLLKYREHNIEEIQRIGLWYKENFFCNPTEENIVKVFKLDQKRNID